MFSAYINSTLLRFKSQGGSTINGDAAELDVGTERMQQDMNDLRQRQQQNEGELRAMKADITTLQVSDKLQNAEIDSLKETLPEIKSDTTWIRRKITGALITAVIMAVVGGIIGFAINAIYGG